MADVAPFRALRYARPDRGRSRRRRTTSSRRRRATRSAPAPAQRRPPDAARLRGRGGPRSSAPGATRACSSATTSRPCGRCRQDYVGPDGVARRRDGLVASLRVEPYETGAVLPHERTHAGPKESRLRLLRAAHAQLEPIFLLYDGEPPVAVPRARARPRRRGHAALAARRGRASPRRSPTGSC